MASTDTPSPFELSDIERQRLMEELSVKKDLPSNSLGFRIRGQQEIIRCAVMVQIPDELIDATMSVCGMKAFLLDEVREFDLPGGQKEVVDCAAIAALEITDSPMHVHAATDEVYEILNGNGCIILDDSVTEVRTGSVIWIPRGVKHGLASNDPQLPVRALLRFTPGLAPKEKPHLRDEAIFHPSSRQRIAELLAVS